MTSNWKHLTYEWRQSMAGVKRIPEYITSVTILRISTNFFFFLLFHILFMRHDSGSFFFLGETKRSPCFLFVDDWLEQQNIEVLRF